ncbi:FHA domain-containing protein [Roseimaritima ulvae]|uniref:Chromosome partition protein Smc n=1 Tax=Roseimaritima ulvae TaxID=980254 RepID=A0A5B9R405_9BACT|nr:FHA domain-containing protein [Roseimaritima ulvae]QEG41043.1 Chromosome partition protein Smc [Roseimaritima ulvae]
MISQQTLPQSIRLVATNSAGQTAHSVLNAEEGVFIGASSNCGFQLGGEGLSGIHCRLSFESNRLLLHDWMSSGGTHVNGQLLTEEKELGLTDVIQIGDYRIALEAAASPSPSASAQEPADEPADATETVNAANPAAPANEAHGLFVAEIAEQASAFEPVSAAYSETPNHQHSAPLPGTESELTESVVDETVMLDDLPVGDVEPVADAFPESEDYPETGQEAASEPTPALDLNSDFFTFEEEATYDAETVALLHAEIEDLQAALAQKDAESSNQESSQRFHGSHSKAAPEEPDTVLDRMQELIDEANRSDERVAILEEMLHAAESKNRAEQEERAQLEAWVEEIESRIGQREDEQRAEVDSLRQRLETSQQQQERLQRQLQQAAFAGGAPKQYEETLEGLQESNHQLQEKLAAAEQQNTTLQRRLKQASADQEVALRKERANIAQEQAKLSRLRFDVSSKLADIEDLPKQENATDRETASRIHALREHLREIHEQEKQEASEVKETTLTNRLAKLWNRVQS